MLSKVLHRLGYKDGWDYVGCVSFEERHVGVLRYFERHLTANTLLLRVTNEGDTVHQRECINKIDEYSRLATGQGFVQPADFVDVTFDHDLVTLRERLMDLTDRCGGKVMVDMSCMPKRFLFLVLKTLILSRAVTDLIVTYTIPVSYAPGNLAGKTNALTELPGSRGLKAPLVIVPEVMIISVGYLPFDLSQASETLATDVPKQVLFPFPTSIQNYRRNWDSLQSIFNDDPQLIPDPIRIDGRDVSYAFDVIAEQTGNGKIAANLYPYGPKTHSLALGLYALACNNAALWYAQPSEYNPEYSSGIRMMGEAPEIYGYLVKHHGANLYSL